MAHPPRHSLAIPTLYRLVFLYLEPLTTCVGAYHAHFRQGDFLAGTHSASAPGQSVPLSTSIILSQLANAFLVFSITQALVLRATSELHVWNTLLVAFLIGDLGHLYTMRVLGNSLFFKYDEWNSLGWGTFAFGYFLITVRLCFLARVGFKKASKAA